MFSRCCFQGVKCKGLLSRDLCDCLHAPTWGAVIEGEKFGAISHAALISPLVLTRSAKQRFPTGQIELLQFSIRAHLTNHGFDFEYGSVLSTEKLLFRANF